jgi:hypothetical protein
MRSLLVVAIVCCPLMASAQEKLNVKTGLWEITASTEMDGMPPMPKEVLDKLTPEQRAGIEASMGSHTETSRECITERDLNEPFDSGNPDECKHDIVRSTRTMQEFKLTCTGEYKGSGTFKIQAPTPETMTGMVDVAIGQGETKMTIKADMKGRWLGPECGEEAEDEDEELDNGEEAEDEGA